MKPKKIRGKKKRHWMDCEIHFKFTGYSVQIFVVKGSRAAILGALATILQTYCLRTCESAVEAVDIVKDTLVSVIEEIKKGEVNANNQL